MTEVFDIDVFLAHHGTKGMKWGVRKNHGLGLSQRHTKREVRVRAQRKKALDNRRHLSDADLQTRINRLQNEKKLKELTEADLTPGRAAAKKVLSESGHQVAKKVVIGATSVAIGAMLAKKFNSKPGLKPEEKIAFNAAKEFLPHLKPKKG